MTERGVSVGAECAGGAPGGSDPPGAKGPRYAPQAPQPLGLFHRAFDKLYPLIRFVYERLLGREWFSEIEPGLWLGGAPDYRRDYLFLLEHRIGAVVDIRAERADDGDFYRDHDIAYVRYGVPDIGVPGEATISDAVDWIARRRAEGRTVLVHCAKGRGRSATLVAAYLMCHHSLDYDQARALLVARRRLTKLESRHRTRIEEWWSGGGCAGAGAALSDGGRAEAAAGPPGARGGSRVGVEASKPPQPAADPGSEPEEHWRERLTPDQYRVLRLAQTERPFSGAFVHLTRDGTFACAGCGRALFTSSDKFDSGSGWPSFLDAVDPDAVVLIEDRSHGMVRTEVRCAGCGGHLGHRFDDGPNPTGLRYCINSVALSFRPVDEP